MGCVAERLVRAVRRRIRRRRAERAMRPANPPIERIAADLRRMLRTHDGVVRTSDIATTARRVRPLEAAISTAALEAARALEVPHPKTSSVRRAGDLAATRAAAGSPGRGSGAAGRRRADPAGQSVLIPPRRSSACTHFWCPRRPPPQRRPLPACDLAGAARAAGFMVLAMAMALTELGARAGPGTSRRRARPRRATRARLPRVAANGASICRPRCPAPFPLASERR